MPGKAARLLLDDPELEYELYLCRKNGWRSLAEMRAGMTQAEFLLWNRFDDKRAQERELEALKAGG